MGTAPQPPETPAMPDPHQAVQRSISMLKRHGFADDQAAAMVYLAATSATRQLNSVGITNTWWLQAIARDAEARARGPIPSGTDYAGDDYGDGSGG